MRAVTIERTGTPVAPNVALVDDWPDLAPSPGELLVRTEASGLNHLDLWVGRGMPGLDLAFPRISGSDGCGLVEAVGEGVDESWIGRRVILNGKIDKHDAIRPGAAPAPPDIWMIGEHGNGCHAACFTAPAANVLDVGDADPVEAAAYALAHLTAWRMLRGGARVEPGQSVLITGIGGGVALAALGLARHLGCRTIVTSRHQWKLDRAIELGADHGVLDNDGDFAREVRGLTGKRGVDICVDSIGKAVHLSCIKSLARGGVFVTCGCTTGPAATTDLARIFWNQLSVIGSTMGDMDDFRATTALFTSGAVRPVVDTVVPPDRCGEAYARIESGEQFGKVVIDWR